MKNYRFLNMIVLSNKFFIISNNCHHFVANVMNLAIDTKDTFTTKSICWLMLFTAKRSKDY